MTVMYECCLKKYLVVLMIAIWPVNYLLAQDCIVKGKIADGSKNLPGATILIDSNSWQADGHGEFLLKVHPGTHVIKVSFVGYEPVSSRFSIDTGAVKTFIFRLSPLSELPGVIKVATRANVIRSNLLSAVPVDVIPNSALLNTGQLTLNQMLNFTVPSFNSSRETLQEPVTLRGLDPQHILILVNEKRLHNTVNYFGGNLKGQLGTGSVSNNLQVVPVLAIDKVEILRDAASAEFGSDAIAGVINIRLKQSTGKTQVNAYAGQYYQSDGDKYSLSVYRGFNLKNKGFISVAGDLQLRYPTYRSGVYMGNVYTKNKQKDDSIVHARSFKREDIVGNTGNLKTINNGILLNGELRVGKKDTIFLTTILNNRRVKREAEYRFPKDSAQINYVLYPDGFQPITVNDATNVFTTLGIKGRLKDDWNWEFSGNVGNNARKTSVSNSNNASQYDLGAEAQTSFYSGKDIFTQFMSDLIVSKRVKNLPQWANLFNVAMGTEWRWENYQKIQGEKASWWNYNPASKKQAGVQGSFGTDTSNTMNVWRNAISAYIDAEAEIQMKLLLNMAVRFEHYSDYGSNIAGKLAIRYRITPVLAIRGSLSNGYRAPTLQQRYDQSISNQWLDATSLNRVSVRGIFPNDHAVTQAFGIPKLTAEKSIDLNAGFTVKFSEHLNATVDAYWIQLKDRIVLSGSFDTTSAEVKAILDDVKNLQVTQVRFFANAINTHTKGIDIALNGNWRFNRARLNIQLAGNFTSTRVYGKVKTTEKLHDDSTLFNKEEQAKIEHGQPASKIILDAKYRVGKFEFNVRNTRFGETKTITLAKSPRDTLYESFSAKILTDVSIGYKPWRFCSITMGVNNLFNVYPDKLKNYGNTADGMLVYSGDAAPFGFNGGYYFLRLSFSL